ncbi:MAG: hypothetical protein QM703_23020 [Gemmatales bacterium]
MQIVIQEILQEKIFLDNTGNLKTGNDEVDLSLAATTDGLDD